MSKALCAVIIPLLLLSSSAARTGFVDDNAMFSLAISALRGAVGQHARALRIAADGNGVEIEAQESHNRNHINHFRYGIVTYMGVPLRRLTGPEPVNRR